MYSEWDLRVYSAAGARKDVSRHWVTSASFELVERGGMASGSLQLLHGMTEPGLVAGDRVDLYLYSVLRYRGWVRTPQSEASDTERSTPTLQGLAERLNGYRVRRVYAYGSYTDLAVIAADLLGDYVTITGRFPSLSVTATTTGVTVKRFDARGKSVAAALSALCDLSGGACYWQGGVNTSTLVDTLTFGPKPTTASQVLALGGSVEALVYPTDTAGIVNRITVKGGQVLQPNLCPNGSFEALVPSSDSAGNLIYNPSFEELSGGAGVGWVTTLAAEWIAGAGHSGNSYVRLGFTTALPSDAEGTVDSGQTNYESRILQGVTYRASAWARRYTSGTASECRLYCIVHDASHAQLATLATAYGDPGNSWTLLTLALDFSAYPTAEHVYVGVQSKSTNAAGGIAVDDVALYQDGTVLQDGWGVTSAGAATVADMDLQVMDPVPADGGLCILLEPANVASASTDWLDIRTSRSARFRVTPGQAYSLIVRWQTDSLGSATVSAGVSTYMADGTAGAGSIESPDTAANPATWQLLSLTFNAAADDQSAEVFVRVKSNTEVYLDAIMLVAGDVPADVRDYGYHWDATTFGATIDTDDAALTGLSTAAAGSLAAYGDRETDVAQTDVVDRTSLLAFATGYFNVWAVPAIEARIRLRASESAHVLNLGSLVRVTGLPVAYAIGALMPNRVRVSVADDVTVDADIGNQRPTLTELIRQEMARRVV